jgi:3-deoxy-manno-octulosonate cytidylyltransferase (CMP-KDO synthetase)
VTVTRVLCVIPARLHSSRFPGKVLADLGGKPVLQHVYERASAASLIGAVVVATDSPEVEAAVRSFGGHAIRIDGPCATGSDRAAAAARSIPSDIVVNLQADQPCIRSSDIDLVVGKLEASTDLDLTTLAFRSDAPAGFASRDVVKVVADTHGRALYFSRAGIPSSVDASGTAWYLHHVGIYCFRRAALERYAALERAELETRESLEQLRALENGMSIGVVIVDHRTVSIDREKDLADAAHVMEREGRASRGGAGEGSEGGRGAQ